MFNGIKKRVTMVEMEEHLINDKNNEYKKSILSKLNLFEGEVSQKILTGLDKDAFEVFNSLKLAISSAKNVIQKF